MAQPKVFIIILNYNARSTLKGCLASIFQLEYENFEVVLVDNNSTDGSLEAAKTFFPRAHIIKNGANLGFAAGSNVGIRYALEKMADYIFLINPDAIVEKDTLRILVKEAEQSANAGIFSPLIIKEDHYSVWFAGGKIKWLTMKTVHIFEPLSNKPYETQYISGCTMFVKKEIFRQIGLLDERFFLYYEDADFCLRARKEGFKIMVIPQVQVYHYEKSEGNLENKIYWLVISGIIFFKKNAPVILKPWISFYTALRRIKNQLDVKFRKNNLAEVVQRAYGDYKNVS
ncbi:MAG: glycosyltransferase family 2 protein [Candidatus Moranbacteria bacterium]|nr:glycosyltransferase family 2 protein [Candidatus Moranbacteria bacterium]